MKITKGIEILEISAEIMGKTNKIHPVIFHDEENIILVDTGFPNQIQLFIDQFKLSEIPFDRINKVILTHQDIDHVGSLPAILGTSAKPIETLAHIVEKAYLEGDSCPVKLAALEAKLNFLPNQMQTLFYSLKAFYENNRLKIDRPLTDGEFLPYCGGITVIFTPGHTPGHICLYHNTSKTLIAGDALGLEEGILTSSPASINFNQDMYISSLNKLAAYDIEAVVCYHGGLYKGEVSKDISVLAESLIKE